MLNLLFNYNNDDGVTILYSKKCMYKRCTCIYNPCVMYVYIDITLSYIF